MIGTDLIRAFQMQLTVLSWKYRHTNYLAVFNFHQVTPAFRPGIHSEWTWTSLSNFEAEIRYLVSILHDSGSGGGIGTPSPPFPAWTLPRDHIDDGDVSVAQFCVLCLRGAATCSDVLHQQHHLSERWALLVHHPHLPAE